MNKELLDSLSFLEHERGIDRESLLSLLEESLMTAAKKATRYTREVSVKIDRTTCDYKCIAKLFVADPVTNPDEEISLEEAVKRYPDAVVGSEVEWEVTPDNFGRIAAQTAKQVIFQRLRQAEKRNICDMYTDQLMQLINGEVRRLDREGVVISFGAAEGLLRREDRIPGENFEVGDLVTALLVEINSDKPGPSLYVSRSHPDFVTRLFEREVTEISDNLVTIKSVAREAGYRSKIAVASSEERIDPVGACVGMRGTRVRTIVRELGGEKVDIIEWSADVPTFVTNALKPAKLLSIKVNEAAHSVRIEVAEDQLSLSIGKKGQNARLASRLTGWKIDIVKVAAPAASEDDFDSRVRKAIETIGAVEGIGMEAAEVLVKNGFASLEGISAPVVDIEDIAKLPGFDNARAVAVIEAAKAALNR